MEETKMCVNEVMVQPEEWGSEKSIEYYARNGAGENLLLRPWTKAPNEVIRRPLPK
ncbi:hypothetical protein J23TS9_28550 [Paenibacillus sp. J23TS9]|uniref:hypothetical protein n=1 Tax=Paenibacillus sp. J23TS9 TaxID=2807193 RepID=UPI001B04C020|nr:hypothetical protein [Paenibacillus sp. J23TS9]GIP27725.1 hypothetical protein J23TS9_28550 [Paenibacillus sp. J23TS9]